MMEQFLNVVWSVVSPVQALASEIKKSLLTFGFCVTKPDLDHVLRFKHTIVIYLDGFITDNKSRGNNEK